MANDRQPVQYHTTTEKDKAMTTNVDIKEWLAARKREALEIDPDNAQVDWAYGQNLDPYGVEPNLPDECYCVGRVYFARRPGGIWVCFYDLPEATRQKLWEKHHRELAFSPKAMLKQYEDFLCNFAERQASTDLPSEQ
jgi:hypothetical protein